MSTEIRWKDDLSAADAAAADGYLSLALAPHMAESIDAKFAAAELTRCKAKDILRAAGVDGAGTDGDPHVKTELAEVEAGKELAPVMLISFADVMVPLIIAAGYHRVCAVHFLDPEAEVPAKLIHIP